MKFYSLFKRVISIKSPRIRLLMLAGAKAVGCRFLGVYLDPVIACNIRCRMCYFSDPNGRPKPQGSMSEDFIRSLHPVFRKALKLQIGCGAEPTLYGNLPSLITAGKKAGIPFIEMTTNGQQLGLDKLRELCQAGLDGITLSLHGTRRATYEDLMKGASFDKFMHLIDALRMIQQEFPAFQLRVNYTVNNLNKAELPEIWQLFGETRIHTLQVRPIQQLGDTDYNDFQIADYNTFISDIIVPLKAECEKRGTISLLPSAKNIEALGRGNERAMNLIESITYCYVTPQSCYRDDFNPADESISRYQRRKGLTRRLWGSIFSLRHRKRDEDVNTTKKLNYS